MSKASYYNGYPLNHIDLIMHRTKNSLSKPKTPRTQDNGNLANISVPYYPALSKPLRQISDRYNIPLTFTSNRNLRNMITKTKTQPPPHTTRNIIYQIPCKDCNATYCGQYSEYPAPIFTGPTPILGTPSESLNSMAIFCVILTSY